MGIRWWPIIGILVLAGCGSGSSGDDVSEAVIDDTGQDFAESSEPASTEAAEPVIDIAVVSIDIPASVSQGEEFPINVTVQNNSDVELAFAELEARAVMSTTMNATDLSVGSGTARNIPPHGSVTAELTATAPTRATVAEITVVATPGSATDPNLDNNQQTGSIVVN